ncbi:hypothetical protein PUR49_32635 [Streptomyces sp. BE147]|uniref:hypothetical protein n=1 Tax=Streptomyces sp. BE147 TaxID=3002524 RepID=UPI002E7663C8|nr:hypothetical protein [Streptomyces sp. BE147]MEE1741219.1 hypothetical protein [Streptomyces sp. BE147]
MQPNADLARQVRDHILDHPVNYETGATMNGPHAELGPGEMPESDPTEGITRLGVAGWAAFLGGHTLLNNRWGDYERNSQAPVLAGNNEGDITDVYLAAAGALNLDNSQASALFRPDLATYVVLDALHQLAQGEPRIDWNAVLDWDADRDPILAQLITGSQWTHDQLMHPAHHDEAILGRPAKSTRDELTAGALIRVNLTARVKSNYGGTITLDNGNELPGYEALNDLTVLTPGWKPGDVATYEGGTLFRTRTHHGHDIWVNGQQDLVWDDRVDPAKVTLTPVAAG